MGRGLSSVGAVVGFLLMALAGSASAADVSPADLKCLACHGSAGMEKPLTDGEKLPLQISGDNFAKSVHSILGCAGCHSDIDLAKHPGGAPTIASRRAFSITRARVCAGCHSTESSGWKLSVHAALVSEGSPIAPICTSCHNPHAVIKGAAEAMDTVPCKACHSDVFAAYAGSIHGMLRNAGVTQAPLCFGCHGAHEVKVPTANEGMKGVCLGCHKEALNSHQKWLPNAQLHFDVVSCPVCHAPKAHRMVDLVLYNSTAKKDAARPVGVPEFESPTGSTDAHAGLDPKTLFKLLQTLNRPGAASLTSITGRLDVRTGVEAHGLTPASAAISDCRTCHQHGAEAFQSVRISVASPSGIPIRYGVNKAVLSSVLSVDSIGGFYAIGGTRITSFDLLLLLALLVGFGIPVLHVSIRWLTRRPNPPHDDQPKGPAE